MLPEWQAGIVRRIEPVNAATSRFFIELPVPFTFRPGQFVTVDLPIHEQRTRRWRSYSIASAPDDGNIIELLIVHVEGGAGTDYLFNEIKEGSAITLRGPHGVFVLPQPLRPDEDLFLICTGTGVAPFRSMAAWLAAHPQLHGAIHLVFGCRTQRELLYQEELEGFVQTIPGFQYHPTLSRESWRGNTGYVHPVYEALCAGRQPAQFMLCGWRAMIDEARARILALGYDKKAVHLELYG